MSVQGDAQAINSLPTCGSRLQDTRPKSTRTFSWTKKKLKTKLKVRRTVNPISHSHTSVCFWAPLSKKKLLSFSCGGCVYNTCYSLEAVLLKKTCLKIEWDYTSLLRRKQGKEGKKNTLGQHHISSGRKGLAGTKSSLPASPLMPLHSIAMSDRYSGRDILI